MSLKDSGLFKPIRIGRSELSSRIVMGPLGSTLTDKNNVLDDSAREYYGKRACVPGTLIIGEATFVSPQASGTTEGRAGIYTEDQIQSWKRIVDSVHEAGSVIYLQLWALGRSADPEVKVRDGTGDVVSSSAVPQEGGPVPRAMTEEEIWTYVSDYATAAEVAVNVAGFDGVELHGGNNSLLDQFTQDVVNQRTDGWGGSIEKRSRFGLAIAAAVRAAVGSDRVGYRITPFSTYQSMGMKDAVPQFCSLLAGLKALGIAYIHLVESRIAGRVDAVSRTDTSHSFRISRNPSLFHDGGGGQRLAFPTCERILFEWDECNESYQRSAIYFNPSFSIPIRVLISPFYRKLVNRLIHSLSSGEPIVPSFSLAASVPSLRPLPLIQSTKAKMCLSHL